ncbi:MAG TPA: exodeoxyribonuclease VII small subunit [Saprospiraceae bacterium]|nr:exodeoxyribonuclease VII small subunit [Saprospiraceae bacterium]
MKNEILNYDTAYYELQQILFDIQQDVTGLDELSDKIKRAAELVSFCKQKLRSTELEIQKLLDSE